MVHSLRVLAEAIHDRKRVGGLTHHYYRYPARFSPVFARAVIETFTSPGDIVIDPFVGGGTTLVEASALGRHSIGVDINSLAVFVSRVKTTLLTKRDCETLLSWKEEIIPTLLLNAKFEPETRVSQDHTAHYTLNLHTPETWRLRQLIQIALGKLELLSSQPQQDFARCALLRTAQWALDCRRSLPSLDEFRRKLACYMEEMIKGNRDLMQTYMRNARTWRRHLAKCLNRDTVGLENDPEIASLSEPKLILTSPPYPGVHVLYHRWQIMSRRETPAPYWITRCSDSKGASFYNFGDRFEKNLSTYYWRTKLAFQSVSRIAGRSTLIVQLVAFSDPEWQLSRYLDVMSECGLREVKFSEIANAPDGRIWRTVPNRKWYASPKSATGCEVVLFHVLA
ncbi:MAG: DNA methyltransferase [Anaerolineae bacterium]|nr:DNA methyltransferase [Anaerolineae bacterium]